ncbi:MULTISPECIES: sensor histidine kinase [Phocaeicola]|uniref:ATP-binding protein n=1 Tax=Phocaeicola dorei TaxID=357276 RepID=A0AB35C878_9BACT|nr:sensor histidine kinase [Phocaeicola dorei]MBV3124160.1 ATP-binding protein [Phocaeicola dorei]
MAAVQFRISSFLKDLIGRELITDEFVAVFELVKNSFDANAKTVKVIFEHQYDPENAKIIIWDDGYGMNINDLNNKWLFVAHSDKRDGSEGKDYRDKIQHKRIFAGAKGVGRFSCDRLGTYLNLITLKNEPNAKIESLNIDWTSFEQDSNKEFIDIKVAHQTNPSISYENFIHGTILEISGLRDKWDRNRILNLKTSLEKLINPIQENNVDDFSIEIIAPDEILRDQKENEIRKKVNGIIKNVVFESLGLKTTQIKVSIIENGGVIQTTLIDRGVEIYSLKEKNPYNKLFDITILLFVLNRAGKMNFKKIMGVNSVEYGSVFIYKNGFRIYPFGEEGDDTLQIDRRKQQGFYRFLGTRDLIGRIEINGEKSNLKETTSRDGGLIKNESWEQLYNFFYDKALKRLEAYTVGIIKWGDEKFDKETGELIQPELKPEDVKDKIFDIITSLTRAKDVIDISYNSDFLHIYEAKQEKSATQLVKNLTRIAEETNNPTFVQQARAVERQVSQLKQAKEEAERENEVIKKEVAAISNKVKLITSENLFLRSDVTKDVQQLENLQHHITHTSNLISEIALQAIDAIKNNDLDLAIKKIDKLLIKNEEIATLSNFVSKAKFDTKVKKINGDIIAFINEYIVNVYSTINKKPIIEIDDYSKHYTMKFVPLEIIIIIENLLRNSIDAKADKVKITWDIGEHPILIYRDNGNGISDDILKHIFDYRFSTTGGGGLGMCHIKDIVQKMNGKIIVNNKLKKGVEFKISF